MQSTDKSDGSPQSTVGQHQNALRGFFYTIAILSLGSWHPHSPSNAIAAVIDFESTPAGGTPVDNAFLWTPYSIAEGGTVRFFFDLDGDRLYEDGVDLPGAFEKTGGQDNDPSSFLNVTLNKLDTPMSGFEDELGDWFLRQPLGVGGVFGAFVIDYDTDAMITAFSGEIWDIDGAPGGTEQWKIEALDSDGNVLRTILSPLGTVNTGPTAYDGAP